MLWSIECTQNALWQKVIVLSEPISSKTRLDINGCYNEGQQDQAEKILKLSNNKLPALAVGKSIAVRVPDVDRGRLAPRSVLAVVLEVSFSGTGAFKKKNQPNWFRLH